MDLVCIGNNRGLNGAKNDAIIAHNYFTAKFHVVKSLMLTEVSDQIKELKNKKIVFFYAGHGSPNNICGKSLVQLLDLLTNKVKKSVLIIIDACHSGSFVQKNVFDKHPFIENYAIITSCKGNQRCSESIASDMPKYLLKNVGFVKNNFHVGVFTYNFFVMANDFGGDIRKICNNGEWKNIEFIGKQSISMSCNTQFRLL